ncbi:MAG: TIGR01777 family oxidoreductase [Bacteroidota bacterium]
MGDRRVVVAGGTGFVGRALVERLAQAGYTPVVLVRKGGTSPRGASETAEWDGMSAGPWHTRLEGACAVVNLAGESIASGRWTRARKQRILSSRLNATRAVVGGMEAASARPSLLINASAVGIYGHVPEGEVTEEHPPGRGFLPGVCFRWEEEALRAKAAGIPTVLLRTGVVLGKGGGALGRMIPPFRLFLGGALGSGRQWFPWIHMEDVCGAVLHLLQKSPVSGILNLAAPESVTMIEFARTLGAVLFRPSLFRVPAPLVRVLLGEMSSMLLEGQKAVPRRLLELGYRFRYPALREALEEIAGG